ncbi:MAG: hypothetical protein Q8K58_05225 [Acidimicrobiales bacterium]|nr:hypothetical protein [Acidimicrobiales bacterium]
MHPFIPIMQSEYAELRQFLIPPRSATLIVGPELLENVIPEPELMAALVQKLESSFGADLYSWTTDPAAYPSQHEGTMQLLVLAALSEIAPSHPNLREHRPIVVRVLDGVDYNSTNIRSKSCDFIIIGSAHFVLLREIAHLMIKLSELDIGQRASEPDPHAVPFVRPLLHLLSTDVPALVELLRPLQRLIVGFDEVEPVDLPPPLGERLVDGTLPSRVVASVINMYNGSDAFVLFHELAHLLNGDQHGTYRALRQELEADRAALSLAIAAHSAVKDPRSHARSMLQNVLRVGGPALLQIFRCVQLLGTSYRIAAQLSDQALSKWEGDLTAEFGAMEELESRVIGLQLALYSFKLPELAKEAHGFTAAYESLVAATKARVLASTEQAAVIDEIGPTDFNAAAERAVTAVRG